MTIPLSLLSSEVEVVQLHAAQGIHRIENAHTNFYVIEDGDQLTVVDCGTPASWRSLEKALAQIGRDTGAIRAVVLTHGHFDHLGFAEQARSALDVPVFVHEADEGLTRKPLSYAHERRRVPYLLRPKAMPIVASLVAQRALWPTPVGSVQTFTSGPLPVPGSPEVVFSPGHTFGHCALFLPNRDTLIAGDAIVTLNPYTGSTGPQIVAGAATANSSRALESLDALRETGAATVLTGHGEPWTEGVEKAVDLARRAGPS
jgi:glyoxylase-like metal-dependent hydrolase (beta-lactamase superfamily II)